MDKLFICFEDTPCSKRKYTLCFLVSTQNLGGVEPLTSQGGTPILNGPLWENSRPVPGRKVSFF